MRNSRASFQHWMAAFLGFGWLMLTMSAVVADEKPSGLSIATFDVDATPPLGFMMAYDPVRKLDELGLRCRGVVLMGSGDPIVLCAVDWIGIGNQSQDIFKESIAKATGTVPTRVAVHTLHQHDAPRSDFGAESLLNQVGASDLGAHDGTFARGVLANLCKAIKKSIRSPIPVSHAAFGTADVKEIASNRRIQDESGKVVTTRYTATRDASIRAMPVGTIDPVCSSLSFYNGDTPVAVLTYYACHPQSYYRTGIPSPDFPGIARFMRSQDFPGPLHVHFNGAGGNVGAGKYNDGSPENRLVLARRLSDAMRRSLEASEKFAITPEDVDWDVQPVSLPPAEHLKRDELTKSLSEYKVGTYWGSPDKLAFLLRCQSGHEIDLGCLSVGGVRILHMPGELFVEYQLAAKKMRPDLHVAMAAYGDYGPGYIGTADAYQQGGYETSERASNVAPEVGSVLMRGIEVLLDVESEPDYSGELSRIPPTPPADVAATFSVADGFKMQLVASEPLVGSPVAIQWDADGAMYVCEMRGYSENRNDRISGIAKLTDEDGDGIYDTRTQFADGLFWPTGLFPYDGGLFVGDAPDLLFLKDTDGDGRADIKQRVLTGFGTSNVQGLLNSFRWGLDNRIHIACSSTGGKIRHAHVFDDESNDEKMDDEEMGDKAMGVDIRGRDLAIDPRTHQFVLTSGAAQHGMCFDDWGHKFVSSNSDHIQQVMYDEQLIADNPYVAMPPARVSIAADGPQAEVFRTSPIEPWRIVRTRLRMAGVAKGPIEGGGRAAGYFTGASGVTIYRGDAWPNQWKGRAFVGDVGGNLIHRKHLERNGLQFTARRIDDQNEFVTSTDNWFRPAQFENAPDGSLHVVDVYREVIEHPDSLPTEIKQHLDLTSGRNRGRIYRIVPAAWQHNSSPRLSDRTTAQWVELLAHPNAWQRETAARLLYERQDPVAAGPLRRMVRDGPSAVARMHALCTLDGLGRLGETSILAALNDRHPQVRRHALQLLDAQNVTPTIAAEFGRLTQDDSIEVRYQLAFAIGRLAADNAIGDRCVNDLGNLIRQDQHDQWMRAAVANAIGDRADELKTRLRNDGSFRGRDAETFLKDLERQIDARDRNPLGKIPFVAISSPINKRTDEQIAAGQSLVARYRDSLSLPADPVRGKDLFTRHCSACHRAGTIGNEVGPNLATMKARGAETILTGMLDPNREVNPQYLGYVARTVDDRVVSGMIVDEGTTSMTLRNADNMTQTILKTDLAEVKNTGKSIMPEGFQNAMDRQAVADLVAFLIH